MSSGYTNAIQWTPPLPPRSRSTAMSGDDQLQAEAPPPIPPRPPGFGYQPLRQAHHMTPSYQQQQSVTRRPLAPNDVSGDHTQPFQPHQPVLDNPSSVPYDPGHSISPAAHIESHDSSDITHHFPHGIIPPPPPRPHPVRSQARAHHDISSGDNGHPHNCNQANSAQGPPPEMMVQAGNPINSLQSHAAVTQGLPPQPHLVNGDTKYSGDGLPKKAGGSERPEQTPLATQENDIDEINDKIQNVSLSSFENATVTSIIFRPDEEAADMEALQPPTTVLTTSPTLGVPKFTSLQETTQPPTDASKNQAHRDPQAVGECIGLWANFKTTWYTHPEAPDYYICSSCYEDHIRGSQFRDRFMGSVCDDGKPRICRFSKPRMKDDLFKSALAIGSLDVVVQHMALRSSIPECSGTDGVNGTAGIKWHRPKNNAVPGMVVCQACYEDRILVHQSLAQHFEPAHIQPTDQMWSCDMAVPYIIREYDVRAKENDWATFAREVSARIALSPCPKEKGIYPDGKKWFTPIDGPQGFLICAACFCDHILHTSQRSKWRHAGENLSRIFGVSVRCCFGPSNMAILASRMFETNNWELFWRGVDAVAREPTCDGKGIPAKSATWYTLHSNPHSFAVCGACYETTVVTYGVADFFTLKKDVSPDATLICSFNPAIPRYAVYMKQLLITALTRDPGPLEQFANEYAFIPLCRGATPINNARWFGWSECTICPECYHEFARTTSLADAMPLKSTQIEGATMCEMYSARMRGLYLEACRFSPPDPTRLLEASFYTFIGRAHESTVQWGRQYDVPGLGHGFSNELEITGAEYKRQAVQVGAQVMGSAVWLQIDTLENRWKAVE